MEVQKAVQRMLRDGYSEADGEYGSLRRKKLRLESTATREGGSEFFFGEDVITLTDGRGERVVWRAVSCATAALSG